MRIEHMFNTELTAFGVNNECPMITDCEIVLKKVLMPEHRYIFSE